MMMGKGGKKKAIPIHINIFVRGAINKVLFMLPSNYKYNYNLMYMKICARYKLKQIQIAHWMAIRHRARRGLL